jgi:hypothetical protein
MIRFQRLSWKKRWHHELSPFVIIGAALLIGGCGQFGDAPPRNKVGMGGGPGCLNELGSTVDLYITGEASETKVGETWDCVIDSMDMFRRFVKGSDDDGSSYTPQDMRALISNYLVTDREIPFSLIQAGFSLKASMFGGSAERISPKEFDRVLALVKVMKKESVGILPNIRHYNRSRDHKGLLDFADALIRASGNFQSALQVEGNLPFPKEHAQVLVNDLGRLFGWDFPHEIVNFAFAAKTLMMGGTSNQIENWAWPRLFRLGGNFSGVLLGIFSAELYPKKDTAEGIRYFLELGRRIQAALHETLDYHGGALHVRYMDEVVDHIPETWVSLPKAAIKSAVRPAINKLFKSRLKDRLEHRSVDFIFGLLQDLGRTQAHIETLYLRSKAGPDGLTRREFEQAAEDYAEILDAKGRGEVERLIRLVHTYIPLYHRDELKAYYGDLEGYSLRYVSILSLIDRLMAHAIEAYSGTITVSKAQFNTIFTDYVDLLDALGVVKKDDKEFADKRFMEANIFLLASNGDQSLSQEEGVYYGLNILSFTIMIPEISDELSPLCGVSEGEGGRMNMDPECFKREFAARGEEYFKRFPFVLNTFRGLNAAQKLQLVGYFMEAGKQKKSPPELWTGPDLDAMIGFMHFAEGIFLRVDTNRDDIIDMNEIRAIFPIYRGLLYDMVTSKITLPSFLTGDGILLGAFAYILRFAKFPAGIGDIPHLVLWLITPMNWQVHSDRFTVIKALGGMAKMM